MFAEDINSFADHKLTKVQMYERFCWMIEMCDLSEKSERALVLSDAKNMGAPHLGPSETGYQAGFDLINK